MDKLSYKILIRAPKEVVWKTLVESDKYDQWVKAFSPNSTCEGEWREGAEMLFWDPNMGGTHAIIEEFRPFESIVAKHINTVTKEGVRETTGDMTEKWIGTKEVYRLVEENGQTRLEIAIHTDMAFEKMFNDAWPMALESIKTLSEEAV